MKRVLTILSLSLIGFTVLGQTGSTSYSGSPYECIYNHLYYLQAESYKPKQSALSFKSDDMRIKHRMDLAVKLKQILDARGDYIDMELIPQEPNYKDTSGKNRYYLLENDRKIYLERYGKDWYYSKATSSKIDAMHNEEFPMGAAFFIDMLPHHLNKKILGIFQWQWLGLLIILFVSFLVYYLIRRVVAQLVIRGFKRFGHHNFARKIIRPVTIPSGIIAASILFNAFYPSLLLPVRLNYLINVVLDVLIPVNAFYILYQLANIFGLYLQRMADKTESKMDDQLVPLIRKSLKAFILIIGIIFVLQNLNFNVTGLLAGLSIGGLALALAAQDTVKNFIGSFMIFLDKPFHIGDWVSGPGFDGTVEEVGFRATRIRTFRDSVQYIPNGKLADMITDNNGKREYRRFNTLISITYDTPPEKIRLFNEGLRQMVLDDPSIRNENYHIYLNQMGDSALQILFYIFFNVPDWAEELKAREKVILKVIELADALEVRFAFPTQSLHIEELPGQSSLTPIHNASEKEMQERIDRILQNFKSNHPDQQGN